MQTLALAPPLHVSEWLNGPPLTLDGLRGRVVLLHAFQMLCPGCVSDGLPQAVRVHGSFARDGVEVIGLHSVFEHHAVMNPQALRAFVHEYRLRLPIAIDAPGSGEAIPQTMRAYALRGTPSLVLIDRRGHIRLSHFGRLDDLQLGAAIGRLLAEPIDPPAEDCDAQRCAIG